MSEPRLRRDDPDRTEPNRSFSGTFQPDAAGGEDFVTRGVRMGYRLVEEQMRRGQQVAQEAGSRFGPARGDMRELAERALRFYGDQYTDAALFWLDAATALTMPVDTAEPDKTAARPVPAPSLAVPLDIASARPTRVTLNLQPGAPLASLQVLTMRAGDASKPPLMDVSFQAGGALPVLRIRVPNEQPADVYHGVVCDPQSGAMLGTLSVEIRES